MILTDIEALWAIMLPQELAAVALAEECICMPYQTDHRGPLLIVEASLTDAPYGRGLGVVDVVRCGAVGSEWRWQMRNAVPLREPWGMIGQPQMWRLEDLCAQKIWSLIRQD